jgi:hydroxymethylbilane synthase
VLGVAVSGPVGRAAVGVGRPPVGAGVLGFQCCEDDTATIEAVTALGDTDAWRQTTAERMLLHVL